MSANGRAERAERVVRGELPQVSFEGTLWLLWMDRCLRLNRPGQRLESAFELIILKVKNRTTVVAGVACINYKLREPPVWHFGPDLTKQVDDPCNSLWVSHSHISLTVELGAYADV